jgi:hypothetical protein
MYIRGDMNGPMTRKQLYVPKRLNQFLKRAARQRGISESEVMRQALEREVEVSTSVVQDSNGALEEIIAFARSLRTYPEKMQGSPFHWDRREMYAEGGTCRCEKGEGE